MAKNDAFAEANRRRFDELSALALNFVSSPGAGKTNLLIATIERLRSEFPIGVVEGDQATERDAERVRACGVPAVQINTGHGCHLDAHAVGHALDELLLRSGSLVLIENIGNLVCPSAFDLGETCKVVILSVAEGDDKPIKYPDMFAAARLMILSKLDLLPHLEFDLERAIAHARRVNPQIEVLGLSVRTGEGLEEWLNWIRAAAEQVSSRSVGVGSERRGAGARSRNRASIFPIGSD
ncbi:MAG: hydrogenase nickel incorporation protein HypB [Rhodospirillales bacterium]|nr:hydrogenase nickel incorporation protein HypB [Rhodospirillales bacterium]